MRARQLSVEWRARLDERLGSWNERLGSSLSVVRARQLSVEWRARLDERLGSWNERLGSLRYGQMMLRWYGSCDFVWRDASYSGALCKWNRFERGASYSGALYEGNRFVYPLTS